MSTPYYRVNGTNFVPFLVGIDWSEEDIDSEESGRTMDGEMQLDLITRKDKHTLSFRTLGVDDVRAIMNALTSSGQIVTVTTNFHPKESGNVTLTMYNSSRNAKLHSAFEDGESVWEVGSFSLIEK